MRCGYCCIKYSVIIIKDPDLPISDKNLLYKETDKRCPHLIGEDMGDFSCAIHNHPEYEDTPCYNHTQIERKETNCRLGEHLIGTKSKVLDPYLNKEGGR